MILGPVIQIIRGFDMLPKLSANNLTDQREGNTVFGCEMIQSNFPENIIRSNIQNSIFAQFRAPVELTNRTSKWIFSLIVPFSFWCYSAALFKTVLSVFFRGSSEQMIRIYALWIIAFMAYLSAVWDAPKFQSKSQSMSGVLALSGFPTTVTKAFESHVPASRNLIYFRQIPKSLNLVLGQFD